MAVIYRGACAGWLHRLHLLDFGVLVMSQTMSLLPRFGSTVGALLLGNNLTSCLFGVTSIQTSIYYGRSSRDGTIMKTTIGVLWVLNAAHLAMVWHVVYHYVVVNFGDPSALLEPTWSIAAIIPLTAVSDLILRGTYAHRIWKLSNSRILMALILISIANTFVASLVFTIKVVPLKQFPDYSNITAIIFWCLASIAITDALVAITLCVLLNKYSPAVSSSRNILRMLIVYGISTGALTCLCALLALVMWAAFPRTFVFEGTMCLLQTLYLNAVLATLNAREYLRDRYYRSDTDAIEMKPSSRLQVRKETTVHTITQVLHLQDNVQSQQEGNELGDLCGKVGEAHVF